MDSNVILSPIHDPAIILAQVKSAFRDDKELMSKYHVLAPCSFEEGVKKTQDDIAAELPLLGDMAQCYQVIHSGMVIGYTIIARHQGLDPELYSFGINIKYRKKFILQSWIEQVKKICGGSLYVVLWDKNERAINFFKKNNFSIEDLTMAPEMAGKTLLTS